jgi:hypothetical protein
MAEAATGIDIFSIRHGIYVVSGNPNILELKIAHIGKLRPSGNVIAPASNRGESIYCQVNQQVIFQHHHGFSPNFPGLPARCDISLYN